jgi:valyl-tRNA synthetase
VLRARAPEPPHELVGRLARLSFDGAAADPLATIGPVEILSSDALDAEQVARRLTARRDELRAEVERAEHKLANEGFVAKAPAEVVDGERRKLEAYRAELAELEA